jgi:hypothetical protein
VAQQQPNAGLLGMYYAGNLPQGTPVAVTLSPTLDATWQAPPVAGLQAPFSVRWVGYLTPGYSEEYRFITTSDDGVRLWINGQQLIDNWSIHAATEDEGRIRLQAGQRYPLVLEFFDRGIEGVIKLEWQSSSQPRQVIPASALAAPTGLFGQYYAGSEPGGTPILAAPIEQLDLAWQATPPINGVQAPFAARWVGYLRPRYSEEYRLITTSDDGVRLWVDGQQLINNWSIHAATEDSAAITLEAGRFYPLVIEFFDRGINGQIKLEWESRSQVRQVVPQEALFAERIVTAEAPISGPGLRASYYGNRDLSGMPVATSIDGPINGSWGAGGGPIPGLVAPLSIRWEGFLLAPTGGEYTLITTGDDGVRLWVDGRVLIDSWQVRYATEDRATVRLQANQPTPIRIDYFDRGFDGVIKLEWQRAGGPRELIPRTALQHSSSTGEEGPIERDGDAAIFRPRALSLADDEVVNPLRGLYRWNRQEYAPQPRPAYDSYQRYSWRQVEPAPGQYDWSLIDADVADAARQGRKHSMRIRALVSRSGKFVPDYLVELMEHGWWADVNQIGTDDTYVPDWNDPDFLQRLGLLIDAFGERYNGDPRISFVDVGFYGNWGEWTMWPLQGDPPGAAEPARPESLRFIVDRMARAFPDTQLMIGTEEDVTLGYALRTYPTMGWRRDSLGSTHFTEGGVMRRIRANEETWRLMQERWRYVPVITEFIGPGAQTDPEVYQLAQQQVVDFHVSMVSNGNTFRWQRISPEGRAAFVHLGKLAGYRLGLSELRIDADLAGPLVVETKWGNSGSARIYEEWQVFLQIRQADDGRLVYEAPLAVDLGTVMPGETRLFTQQLAFGQNLPAGPYQLVVVIRDPTNYRAPLALAQHGRQADGSYLVGVLRVE